MHHRYILTHNHLISMHNHYWQSLTICDPLNHSHIMHVIIATSSTSTTCAMTVVIR